MAGVDPPSGQDGEHLVVEDPSDEGEGSGLRRVTQAILAIYLAPVLLLVLVLGAVAGVVAGVFRVAAWACFQWPRGRRSEAVPAGSNRLW